MNKYQRKQAEQEQDLLLVQPRCMHPLTLRCVEKFKNWRINIFLVEKYVYIFGGLKKVGYQKKWGHLGVRKWPRRATTKKIQMGS